MKKIFFIGFSNSKGEEYDELYSYINLKLEDLCKDYDILFISSDNSFDSNENVKIYKKISKNIDI